ncbi:FAD-dependent oxidoreductase [Candidatus Babeliales bacterium]|nr:FAD-dependent oxidoreductase [Candidatus Babeliales bacterium]
MYKKIVSCAFVLTFFSGCFQADQVSKQAKRSYQLAHVSFDQVTYPVVVLGGGIAGFTAANYLVQANVPTVVLEGPKPGGALAQSPSVRNWPGVLDAPGADIMKSLREQAVHYGATVLPESVTSVRFDAWPFELDVRDVNTNATRTIKALSCIVATGAEPNYLGIPGEQEFWGKGVTNCAVCDGGLCKGKDVVVVGGGDSAVLEAAYLAGIARSVTLVVRKDYFRANDKKKRDQVLALPNVTVLYNTRVTQVHGDGKHMTHLSLENDTAKTKRPMDGLFLAIGARPNTGIVANALELDAHGYLVLKNGQATSVDGVFAAGDVCDPVYKQAVTSAGGGCAAALQVQAFLDDLGFNAHMLTQPKVVPSTPVDVAPSAPRAVPAQAVDAGPAVALLNDNQAITQFIQQQSKPIIIDLSAEWCMPCKRLAPIFEKLAGKYRNDISCAKVDINKVDVQALTNAVGGEVIDGVPTLLFIKDGQEVGRLVGLLPADELEKNFKILASS